MVGDQVQTTISIPASQATFIASGQPNNSFGYSTQLGIGYNSPSYQAMRILIKFKLSAIPANATINSASVQIYQYKSILANDSPMGIQVQYASQYWDETATWNTAKSIGENPPLGVGNFDNSIGWKYGTATNVVRNWYSGAKPNNGVLLIGDFGRDLPREVVCSAHVAGVEDHDVEVAGQAPVLEPVVEEEDVGAEGPRARHERARIDGLAWWTSCWAVPATRRILPTSGKGTSIRRPPTIASSPNS